MFGVQEKFLFDLHYRARHYYKHRRSFRPQPIPAVDLGACHDFLSVLALGEIFHLWRFDQFSINRDLKIIEESHERRVILDMDKKLQCRERETAPEIDHARIDAVPSAFGETRAVAGKSAFEILCFRDPKTRARSKD